MSDQALKTWEVWFRYDEECGQLVKVDAVDQIAALEEGFRTYERLYPNPWGPIWAIQITEAKP